MAARVVMTLLVRNEEDVIADNIIFHHSQGISHFVVMDNLSTDATPLILRRLAKFVPITLLWQSSDTYDQALWVTEMARSAYRDHGADWVINNDADEFWLFPGGDIPSFLDSIDPSVAGFYVKRFDAVLSKKCRARACLAHPSRSRFFWRESVNALNRPLPHKCMHRSFADVNVAQGNHDISGHKGVILFNDQISILHFPYRRFSSYKSKIRLGGDAYRRNALLPRSLGKAWRVQRKVLSSQGLGEFWRGLQVSPEGLSQGLSVGQIIEVNRLFRAVKYLRVKYRWFWIKCFFLRLICWNKRLI